MTPAEEELLLVAAATSSAPVTEAVADTGEPDALGLVMLGVALTALALELGVATAVLVNVAASVRVGVVVDDIAAKVGVNVLVGVRVRVCVPVLLLPFVGVGVPVMPFVSVGVTVVPPPLLDVTMTPAQVPPIGEGKVTDGATTRPHVLLAAHQPQYAPLAKQADWLVVKAPVAVMKQ